MMDEKRDFFNLEQIILAQVDEPAQKACIYRVSLKASREYEA